MRNWIEINVGHFEISEGLNWIDNKSKITQPVFFFQSKVRWASIDLLNQTQDYQDLTI